MVALQSEPDAHATGDSSAIAIGENLPPASDNSIALGGDAQSSGEFSVANGGGSVALRG